jgi:hypothetical protein
VARYASVVDHAMIERRKKVELVCVVVNGEDDDDDVNEVGGEAQEASNESS